MLLASRGYRLIYGGSDAGLMKTMSDAFLDAGGYAIGVSISTIAEHHPINPRCQEKILVGNLAERKAYMMAHAARLIHPHAKSILKIDSDPVRLLDTLLKPF